MHNKIKVFVAILILLVVLIISRVSTKVGKANQLALLSNNTVSNSIERTTLIYLPCTENNFCTPETVESPFSINISALHQITSTNTTNPDLAEQQYVAWYNQSFPTLVSALKDSGAGWTRIVIRWFDIEPDAPLPGQPPIYNPDMLQWYDNRLGQIAQAGVKMIAVINSAPAWANTGGQICPPVTEDHLDDYQQFVTDLVTRYSKAPYNIKTWEIFNEADNASPDLADPYGCFGEYGSLYSQILENSYSAIKVVDPNATILMSGIAYENWTESPYNGAFYRYFPDDVMISGGASFFDALNFHYFPDYHLEWERWNPPAQPTCSRPPGDPAYASYDGSGIDVITKKNFYMNRMSTCFGVNKPVWLTELSQHGVVGDDGSLRNQAYYVIRGYSRSLAAGIKNITWYALADNYDGFDQSLLYPDLSPKPGFITYKILASQLKNYQFVRTLIIPGGEGYVFSNSCGDEKIIAWGNNVPLTISPASSIEVTNYLGEVTPIKDGEVGDGDGMMNGSIQVTLFVDPMEDYNQDPNNLDPTIPIFISVISP